MHHLRNGQTKRGLSTQWNITRTIKGAELLACAATQANLENTLLCESRLTRGPGIMRLHLCEISRVGKSTETESRVAAARAVETRLGGTGVTANGYSFFWGQYNVWGQTVVVVVHPCVQTGNH